MQACTPVRRLIFALVVFGFLLVACGGGGEDPNNSGAAVDAYDQYVQDQALQDWQIEQDAAQLDQWSATQDADYHLLDHYDDAEPPPDWP